MGCSNENPQILQTNDGESAEIISSKIITNIGPRGITIWQTLLSAIIIHQIRVILLLISVSLFTLIDITKNG